MDRRALLRAGAVVGLGVTAGCLDTLDRITWTTGVGTLHRPGEIRIDGRDPADGHGAGALFYDADATDVVTGASDLAALEAVGNTDWETAGLLVVQISRPTETASAIDLEPGGPDRSGLRGLAASADVRRWGELPESLSDADRLEYTLGQRFDRPRSLVPRAATVTVSDPDGDRLGEIEAT